MIYIHIYIKQTYVEKYVKKGEKISLRKLFHDKIQNFKNQ